MFYSIKAKKKCEISFFFNGYFTSLLNNIMYYFYCTNDNLWVFVNNGQPMAFSAKSKSF